jgi:hypothetical protein
MSPYPGETIRSGTRWFENKPSNSITTKMIGYGDKKSMGKTKKYGLDETLQPKPIRVTESLHDFYHSK